VVPRQRARPARGPGVRPGAHLQVRVCVRVCLCVCVCACVSAWACVCLRARKMHGASLRCSRVVAECHTTHTHTSGSAQDLGRMTARPGPYAHFANLNVPEAICGGKKLVEIRANLTRRSSPNRPISARKCTLSGVGSANGNTDTHARKPSCGTHAHAHTPPTPPLLLPPEPPQTKQLPPQPNKHHHRCCRLNS
jgi:hypothetical protein